MSRIGREPIAVPAGVTVTVAEGNAVTVKGPLGELSSKFCPEIEIKQDGAVINVCRPNDQKEMRALHGLTRTLLNNMVVGVKDGFEKKLDDLGKIDLACPHNIVKRITDKNRHPQGQGD